MSDAPIDDRRSQRDRGLLNHYGRLLRRLVQPSVIEKPSVFWRGIMLLLLAFVLPFLCVCAALVVIVDKIVGAIADGETPAWAGVYLLVSAAILVGTGTIRRVARSRKK